MGRTIAIATLSFALLGCATQKQWTPIGGSRADGVVRLAFEFSMFERPQVDEQRGLYLAGQRCEAWGYASAEPFGGVTRDCVSSSMGSCELWRATREYQCIGDLSQ